MTTNNASNIVNVTSGSNVAWVKVQSLVASNSSLLEFTIDATTYRSYEFILESIQPVSNTTALVCQVKTGGSYYTGTDYVSILFYNSSGGAVTLLNNQTGSYLQLIKNSLNNDQSLGGILRTHALPNGSFGMQCTAEWYDSTGGYRVSSSGTLRYGAGSGANCTNIKFYMSSGNISAGTITQYGQLL